jgi:hypothetical protein
MFARYFSVYLQYISWTSVLEIKYEVMIPLLCVYVIQRTRTSLLETNRIVSEYCPFTGYRLFRAVKSRASGYNTPLLLHILTVRDSNLSPEIQRSSIVFLRSS